MRISDFVLYIQNDDPNSPCPSAQRMQTIYRFPNNYGASVVRGYVPHSKRGCFYSETDSYEVAVLRFTGPGQYDSVIDYNTPITDDVLGYIAEGEQLEHVLTQISEL